MKTKIPGHSIFGWLKSNRRGLYLYLGIKHFASPWKVQRIAHYPDKYIDHEAIIKDLLKHGVVKQRA
jgi:hypothetical protein